MKERWRPSVTVAAVIEHEGRFLLVEEHTPEGLRLNNPAGHLEPGETPQQAVVREALEETGRAFEPESLLGVYLARFVRPAGIAGATGSALAQERPEEEAEDITYLRFAYSGRVGEPLPGRVLDAAIVRTLWLTREEIAREMPRHRSPLVMRCIDDHLAGRRHALDLVRGDETLYRPRVLPAGDMTGDMTMRAMPETTEPAPPEAAPAQQLPALAEQADRDESAALVEAAGVPAASPERPEPTLAETAAALAERFPALFSPGAPRPIKLRIQADIQARAPGAFTKKQLSIFLHRHTTSTAYIRALVMATQRFDLDGQEAGEIQPEHLEAARAELERRRQIVMQRRASGRARPGAMVPPQDALALGVPAAAGEPGPERAREPGPGPGPGPREGERPPRVPRPPRPPRAAQPGRPTQPDHAARGPRPPDSGEPGARPAHGERASRPPHPDASRRPAHADRPPRFAGADRAPRPPREERAMRPPRASGLPGASGPSRSPAPETPPELPMDPARRERAMLLRSFEGSPLTAANFCALKGLALNEFDAQLALARRERDERARGSGGAS